MTKFNAIFLVLVIASSLTAGTHGQTLKAAAGKHGKYFGYAVNAQHLTQQPQLTQIGDQQFDCVTPENAMKWGPIEGSRGHENFGEADAIVSHAQQHGQKVRGHTLIWHSQLPGWAEGINSAADMHSVMQKHISSVMGHFKGKIYAWDVCNEVFNEDGSLRQSVFMRTVGKGFIAEAFKLAAQADPGAKLYINDYNIEGINAKSTGLYNLVKELKGQGVPIHGVGFQSHFQSGSIPHDFQQNLQRFAALGVDVAITELDIKGNNAQQQAQDYANVVKACVAVPRCVGITVWGISDKYSWITSGAPLLYDNNLHEKPAVAAIKAAFG